MFSNIFFLIFRQKMLSNNAKLEFFLNKQLAGESALKRKRKVQAAYCQPISLTKKPIERTRKPSKQTKKLTSVQKKVFRGKLKNSDFSKVSYEQFLPLNELHREYLQNVLSNHMHKVQNLQAELLKLDLHGAELEVLRSSCESLVGKLGIVVMETKFCFKIVVKSKNKDVEEGEVLKNDKILTIPKKGTIFGLKFSLKAKTSKNSDNSGENEELKAFKCTIYGDNFCLAPGMRIPKKFKNAPKIPLI